MTVTLHGYRLSVYNRVARMALEAKGVPYDRIEINPFIRPIPASHADLHPFGRVPALDHDGFVIYETTAITQYINEAFDGPDLVPAELAARTRMRQLIAVIDNYAYWPLVRQIYVHGVVRPRDGGQVDADELKRGLTAAPRVLAAMEKLAGGWPYLVGDRLSLGDLHLAPMIDYFLQEPRGRTLFEAHPRLSAWWQVMARHPVMSATIPG
jgi:glutathione S-transferase